MKFILCAFLSLTQLIWSSTKPPPISSSPILINQTWSPPPLGWVKFNFAASTTSSTVGTVARSSEGVLLGGWAARCGHSGEVGEACAAQLACTAASAHGYSRVVLEGDSDGDSVVNAINGGSGSSWEAHVYVHDCMQILGELESFLVRSVDRSANEDTHRWVSWADSNDFQGFLVGDDLSLLVAGLDHDH